MGAAMRATEQNPEVAGLMGVNINCVIALTFVIGSAPGRGGRIDGGRSTTASATTTWASCWD